MRPLIRCSEMFMPSPVGPLRLVASERALVGVFFEHHRPAPSIEAEAVLGHPIIECVRSQLLEYFEGRRSSFDVPIEFGGTPFQRAVWTALRDIPPGVIVSYAELARRIGRPRAVRAVGAANARNPLSIVVPCHRVVGADRSLTGYAGGLVAKRWLLEHEARQRSAPERSGDHCGARSA